MDVDKIILPEEEMGIKLAKGIMNRSLIEIIDLSEEYSLVELNAPEKWIDKTLSELIMNQDLKVSTSENFSSHTLTYPLW